MEHSNSGLGDKIAIAIFVSSDPKTWIPTFQSIARWYPNAPIYLGLTQMDGSDVVDSTVQQMGISIEKKHVTSVSDLLNWVYLTTLQHVLLVSAPILFVEGLLDPAVKIASADLRCSSVSFFSNAAGYLSFPNRNLPSFHQVEGLDESIINSRLRSRSSTLKATPIPYAAGPAVLLSSQGLSVIWPPPSEPTQSVEYTLALLSSSARSRGMVDYLDPSTYVMVPADVPMEYLVGGFMSAGDLLSFANTSPALQQVPDQGSEYDNSFAEAFAQARCAVFGLRVLIDATCVGPREMGSQVTVVSLIRALAKRKDIAYIGVAMANDTPTYARDAFQSQKIDIRRIRDGDFTRFPDVDIVHRPFQPGTDMNLASWRIVGRRCLITILDLIAYQVPTYFGSPVDWFSYRDTMRYACAWVDGVVVISHDVAASVEHERLQIDRERTFVVAPGVDHLRGDEPDEMPEELFRRGFTGEEFLLVLGTNYSHKNRDLAVRVLNELNNRGHALSLVLAGANVPKGSSRVAEAASWAQKSSVYVLPDVNSLERNWLFRHASVVLYPTSAEGFGLVPDEAAAFGTPTVFVPFGPFAERYEKLPVAPSDWSVSSFADAAESLINNPALSHQQVSVIVNSPTDYDWDSAASLMVSAYRELLARPARSRPQIK